MVNGYRKEKDIESRERWVIARKLMWSAMWANAKSGFTETQICIFPWEENMYREMTIEESEKLIEDVENVKSFWLSIDEKRKNRA